MNGEVLAKKKSTVEIKKVGLGQKRQVVKEKISKSYPNVTEIVEMNPRTLPYSLEAGQIDGAVLDVTKASLLPEFQFLPLSDEDYISYVLIVRKDILETKNFGTFIKSYNKAVEELQDREKLPELLGMTKEFWEMSQVKFLSIEP